MLYISIRNKLNNKIPTQKDRLARKGFTWAESDIRKTCNIINKIIGKEKQIGIDDITNKTFM